MGNLIRKLVIIFLVMSVLFAISCTEKKYDEEADKTAIAELREQEMVAFSSADVSALETLFTTDTKVMPPNGPAATGTEGLRAFAENMFSMVNVQGEYTSSELTLLGDWAFERLTMNLTLTPVGGGEPVTETGKCLHIYKRQADGSWKIAQDIWNMDAPAAPQVSE
jgi:uncharacterized protein (TIGR02246 family)